MISDESCILLWAGFLENKGFTLIPLSLERVEPIYVRQVSVCVRLLGLLCLARCLLVFLWIIAGSWPQPYWLQVDWRCNKSTKHRNSKEIECLKDGQSSNHKYVYECKSSKTHRRNCFSCPKLEIRQNIRFYAHKMLWVKQLVVLNQFNMDVKSLKHRSQKILNCAWMMYIQTQWNRQSIQSVT